MKISMICFSLTGFATGSRLKEALETENYRVTLDKKSRYLPDAIAYSTGEWAAEQFQKADALIFIGACGIAVRSIAPYIVSKKKDPAVLVVDECGKFVISLLSGHLGGANELTEMVSEVLGAQSVVTTATDLHGRFAVDVFAKKNQAEIRNMTAAKEVSAAILAGEPVGFYSEFPWEGALPDGLVRCDKNGFPADKEGSGEVPEAGVAVTIHKSCQPFPSTTAVIPKVLYLGMGCKKGKDRETIANEAQKMLNRNDFCKEAFQKIVSIDLKKEEQGILSLAESWGIPFETYSSQELLAVPGEFTPSSFVKGITGVDNVCERSAVLASENGRLLQKKRGENGVTTAVAAKEWRIRFE
ncbi:MAG: cobalt-precorrin 5A hydrolase [Eubacteriales bacterium]|nr:cobalt-precorrin 5A hydrolase [Eubacteriales bacterium]